MAFVRFLFLSSLKILCRAFYRFRLERVGKAHTRPFRDMKVAVLLNHTSLFEPIFLGALPLGWIWDVSYRGLLPGADSTLNRPVAGRFFKWILPETISITRNRDRTWTDFMGRVRREIIVIMAPEGRMKRKNGLDKYGKPMTVRGGIVDVLECVDEGVFFIFYSQGLHHVQAPGEGFPRLFREVRARFEEVPVEIYKKEMGHGTPEFRANVIADLERRRDRHCGWDG